MSAVSQRDLRPGCLSPQVASRRTWRPKKHGWTAHRRATLLGSNTAKVEYRHFTPLKDADEQLPRPTPRSTTCVAELLDPPSSHFFNLFWTSLVGPTLLASSPGQKRAHILRLSPPVSVTMVQVQHQGRPLGSPSARHVAMLIFLILRILRPLMCCQSSACLSIRTIFEPTYRDVR